MSDTVIKVENLSKKYQLGTIGTGTLFRDLNLYWAKMRGKKNPYARIDESGDFNDISEHWALKDISFEIKQGDAVGIIGKNGAGKSTLLKILSRITTPTTGNIKIKGRVASLLEVGTGFSGELTGKENIYLNGAILGMDKAYINKRLEEIVEFSGVSKYIDTPVKRYSSGMYVRLAFAVAAHLEPEILVVDEVLAVGDAEFQKKCLGKMNDANKNEGRTVLFVSHDMQAVSALTRSAIFLKNGSVNLIGETREVINTYLSNVKTSDLIYTDQPSGTPKIIHAELFTSLPNNHHKNGQELKIKIKIHTPFAIKGACFALQIVDNKDKNFVHLWTFDSDIPMCREEGIFELVVTIPKLRLYMGKYSLKLYLSEPPGGNVFQVIENICPFEVVMYDINRQFTWYPEACAYIEESEWKVTKSNV